MKTEQEIKSRVTLEIMKKMVELAEGFEFINSNYPVIKTPNRKSQHGGAFWLEELLEDTLSFSTLIHRAVEGWNKKEDERKIIIYNGTVNISKDLYYDDSSFDIEYHAQQYQTENLTQLECALLDCLMDILGEI